MLTVIYFMMFTVVIFMKTDGFASWSLFFVSGIGLLLGFFYLKAKGHQWDEEDDYVH